jgi:hypothetical protein
VEAAHGILNKRFAFCQTMPLADFLVLVEELRRYWYRPIGFRPYAAGQSLLVAAVWTRDPPPALDPIPFGVPYWLLYHGLSAEEILRQNEGYKGSPFAPVDIASYHIKGVEHYGGVWSRVRRSEDSQITLGMDEESRYRR